MRRTPTTDDLLALDVLHNATKYIRARFRMDMTRDEAQANLDSRALIFRCQNKILDEYGEGVIWAQRDERLPHPQRSCCTEAPIAPSSQLRPE